MSLQALPKDTVRLIKSTQVITTPASVVKELVENSVDAGATTVAIRMENHGFSYLEVRDNGSGIADEDVSFIAKPHFTSKISTFSDLESLNTYGFRGEALASLCAVAEVTVTTKTKDSTMGHTYTLDRTGSVCTTKPAATPNGTTVIVRNLFKNVPVRRQYYSAAKRRKEEMKKVEDLVLALTLAVPGVHLSLSHDKCNIVQKNSAQNIQEAIMNTFPAVYRDLVFRVKRVEDTQIEIFLPGSRYSDNPGLSRTLPDRLFVLVNQRPVTHKSIEKVVKFHYSQSREGSHGRYPLGVVALTLPPSEVDVNLEPNKTKILLKDENQILETIKEMLNELYGHIDQPEEWDGQKATKLAEQTDITCTFSCITQDSREPVKEIKFGLKAKDKNDQTKCSGVKRVLSTKQFTTSKDTDGMGSAGNNGFGAVIESDQNSSSPEIKNMERQQERKSVTAVETPDVDASNFMKTSEKTNKENVYNVNNAKKTSTQNSGTDDTLPSIAESCILPDEHHCENSHDEILGFMESESDTSKSSKQEISGIVPLSLNGTSVFNESNFGILEDTIMSGQKRQNTSSLLPSKFNKSHLHESFTGSDGIPVYKIPPLPPPDIMEVEQENGQHCRLKEGSDNCSRGASNSIFKEVSAPSNLGGVLNHKPPDCLGKESTSKGSWSRGLAIEGKNIQTVQLLSAGQQLSNKRSPVGSDAGKRVRSADLSETEGSTAVPPKKTKINSLGPSSFDYIHGKPVKKPSSPFVLFSRDIRSQVLSEHPGADFAVIAKEMAERWKTLDHEKKSHYREQSKAEADRYQQEVKSIRESRGLNTSMQSSSKKGLMTGASLDRYIAPLTPRLVRSKAGGVQQQPLVASQPWQQHSKEVNFTIDIIRDKLKNRQAEPFSSDNLSLLGKVTSAEGWVCLQGTRIMALNVYRLHEVVLCKTLLRTFKLPVKQLDNSLPFNASTLGLDNWTALLKLPRELVPHHNFYNVTDQRLTANGFKVALFPGTMSSVAISHGEVTHLTDVIGFYGISDLKDVLSILVTSPTATLQQTRPLKLQYWIKAEAVRMIRLGPNILSQDDVLEKLKKWQLILNDNGVGQPSWEQTCIHNKPIFTHLQSLEDLPKPQAQISQDLSGK